jgi:hypothetical protein
MVAVGPYAYSVTRVSEEWYSDAERRRRAIRLSERFVFEYRLSWRSEYGYEYEKSRPFQPPKFTLRNFNP